MKRLTSFVALVASFTLLIGATAAIGATRPDDRATHGQGGVVALEQSNGVVHPDDRATHGPGAVTIWQSNGVVRPDDRPTHGPGASTLEQLTGVAQVPVIAPGGSGTARVDGFDWLDAAIGAAAVLGLGLIIAGGVAFLFRRANAPAYS